MAEPPNEYGRQFRPYGVPVNPPSSGPSGTEPYYTNQGGALPLIQYNASVSTSAFESNLHRIPGLALGGQAPPSTTVPFVATPAWVPPMPVLGHGSQPHAYLPAHQQSAATLPPRPSFQHPAPPLPLHLPDKTSRTDVLEEGELSECEREFEDLYDPGPTNGASYVVPESRSRSTQLSNKMDSRKSSIGDGSSIYDPHDPLITQGETVAQTATNDGPAAEQDYPDDEWEPSYPDRDRSGSYSPYLSPREVHRKGSLAKTMSRDNKAADPFASSQAPHLTGLPLSASLNPTIQSDSLLPIPIPDTGISGSSSLEGKSAVQEAKKKAQEAILALLRYKVRYPDYIDEGVNENVVQHLFKELGLDVPNSKTTNVPSKATSGSQMSTAMETLPSHTPLQSQSLQPPKSQMPLLDTAQRNSKAEKEPTTEANVSGKSAAEERKDKIARKLAAIGQKATTAQSAQPPAPVASVSAAVSAPVPATHPADEPPTTASGPLPVPPPVSVHAESVVSVRPKSNVNTPPVPLKTRAENNAILQQKLAALKKQQAQMAADKARLASNESTTVSSPTVVDLNATGKNSNGASNTKTIPVGSTQQNASQALPGGPRCNSKDESIPGLSFTPLVLNYPAQGPNRGVKRPVASDFDNYTPRFSTPKRSRTNETLIIDVSDDEDVEMDIGSPVDELSPIRDTSAAPTSQALAAFPPLSDGASKCQQSSSSSSLAPTPPVPETRIDILRKKIEATKRLIAEAEAKKAAKKATAQPSPNPMSPNTLQRLDSPRSHEDSADERRAIHERRDRIVTYELPRVDAALKLKQDKLRTIVAEAARLELEVQATLDERQKLTVEMADLTVTDDKRSPSLAANTDSETAQVLSSGQNTPSHIEQLHRDEHSTEPPSHIKKLSSTIENGHTSTDLSNDEACQAAVFTDSIMTGTDDAALAADDCPNTQGLIDDGPPRPLESTGPVRLVSSQLDTAAERTAKPVTIDSLSKEPALPITSIASSIQLYGVNGGTLPMGPSAPQLPSNDDELYEPVPSLSTELNDAQMDEETSTEVVNDAVRETRPNHASGVQNFREPEPTTANEVNNRIFEEPPLLTPSQENQSNTPAVEDLLSYKSPLSYFRAFRFHPKYFEEVPGGLKSMTFSARIDPMRELCPKVLAGESCPKGPNCEYQHFDSMMVAESEIIAQLGSADIFTGETRDRFIESLKRVLNDLKAKRIKDFDRITKAIVKHRQDFLGDQSKVLSLDSSIV